MSEESVPFFAISNDELAEKPDARPGTLVRCPVCGGEHPLEEGEPPGMLLFYRCGEKSYIGALNGRLLDDLQGVSP